MKISCKQILLDYLKETPGWVKKVSLYAVAEDFSPETVGRELRTLQEEGAIHVGYYDGKYAKGLAQYSYDPPLKAIQKVDIINGVAHISY